MKALEYRAAPREVAIDERPRDLVASAPFAGEVATRLPHEGALARRGVYLSCGSSHASDLRDGSVDLVVTDPPFFDNVHYSELADFFHAWQVLHPRGFVTDGATTRNAREVQDTRAAAFADKLRAVFTECHRVLKDDGLMVFSYHHSRADGWSSLADAIVGAGFSVVEAHPVRAEMSGATPKSQASEPIQLDVLLVCRKRATDPRAVRTAAEAWVCADEVSAQRCARLEAAGFALSKHDRVVVRCAQVLVALGPVEVVAESMWSDEVVRGSHPPPAPTAAREAAPRSAKAVQGELLLR